MFSIFTPQGKLIIDCEFYSTDDASEYAQAELRLFPNSFIVRKVDECEQQPYTKEDF